MTRILKLAGLAALLATAAVPAFATDSSKLLGTPAVSEDELGTHRAKGEEVPLDQATNPGPTGFPGSFNSHGAPNAGGGSPQSTSYSAGAAGGGRSVAVGIQGGSVSWTH